MKECLLCSAPLKLIDFKCAEGHVSQNLLRESQYEISISDNQKENQSRAIGNYESTS